MVSLGYYRPTNQTQFGKPAKYGPPDYDVRYRKRLQKKIDLANFKNRAYYMSDWRETQKWLNRNRRLDKKLKIEATALYKEIKAQIKRTSDKSDKTTSHLDRELKMGRFKNLNYTEDRHIYLIYTNRGGLSAADTARRERGEKSWFVAALERRSKGKKINDVTGR